MHHGFPDRLVAASLLVAASPFILVIYSIITYFGEDPLFRQDRVGYEGRIFTILKFRTIPSQGWETWSAATHPARAKACRRFAEMLRTTGIDELPQLWNIVCGEMRFIGPRPLTPQDYAALPESRSLRCRSQPGLTGLAQVNGGQALDPALKLALDLYLIDRRSLGMSLGIMARSLGRLVGLTVFVRAPNRLLLKEAQTILRVRLQHPLTAGYSVAGSFKAARNGADKAVA